MLAWLNSKGIVHGDIKPTNITYFGDKYYLLDCIKKKINYFYELFFY